MKSRTNICNCPPNTSWNQELYNIESTHRRMTCQTFIQEFNNEAVFSAECTPTGASTTEHSDGMTQERRDPHNSWQISIIPVSVSSTRYLSRCSLIRPFFCNLPRKEPRNAFAEQFIDPFGDLGYGGEFSILEIAKRSRHNPHKQEMPRMEDLFALKVHLGF